MRKVLAKVYRKFIIVLGGLLRVAVDVIILALSVILVSECHSWLR